MNTGRDDASFSPDDSVDAAMLDRYLSGEASDDEQHLVDAWIAASPARARWLANIREAMTTAFGSSLVDTVRAQRSLIKRIERHPLSPIAMGQQTVPLTPPKIENIGGARGWFKNQPLRRIAQYSVAGLMIGVLGIIVGWHTHTRQGALPRSGVVSRYTTANGERANITLPDGNTVTLNVASQLDVPADYPSGNHTVRLTGEALFTILHHEGRPFTVLAGQTAVRVLGTSFMVRHYATDPTSMVAVRAGKVAVGDVVVTPSRLAEVGPDGSAHVRSSEAAQFSFAAGVLQLDSMPLSRAIVELNRWYAADIRLGDPSLARVAIEGKFSAGSLSDLTSVLELMLDARVVRDGRRLTLYRKGV